MLTRLAAAYLAIEAFAETDTTEDLRKIDMLIPILRPGHAAAGPSTGRLPARSR